MSEHKLVEVYRARDNIQAHLLKSGLADSGIQAVVEGDFLQGALGDIPLGWSTSPRIMVADIDETKAREILQQFEHPEPSEIDP